jgi:hypothetical protein
MVDRPLAPDATKLPAWAMSYADASLRCGCNAQDVESKLVDKGLSSSMAAAVVDKCFENHLHGAAVQERLALRSRRFNRSASLGVVLFFAMTSAISPAPLGNRGRVELFYYCLIRLLLPLACIWFPELVAANERKRHGVSVPPQMLAVAGWLRLLSPFVILFAATVGSRMGLVGQWVCWSVAAGIVLAIVVTGVRKSAYSVDSWKEFREQRAGLDQK